MTLCSRSQRTGRISNTRLGSGDSTTRRQSSPSGATAQPRSVASVRGFVLGVYWADRLGQILERRVVAINLHHREDGRERPLHRKQIAQLLLDHVPDHPLALRTEDVEGVRANVFVGRCLQCQETHLGTVSVRDYELVGVCDGRQRLRRSADVFTLYRGGGMLAPTQQCIPPERHDDAHGGRRSGPERRHQHCLDGVHPVLRLIEHDRLFGFEHIVGYFHSVQPELLEHFISDPRRPIVEGGQAV